MGHTLHLDDLKKRVKRIASIEVPEYYSVPVQMSPKSYANLITPHKWPFIEM